jgi:cation diffusion facilitator CzcD-associated flavoprotein CzcO
MLAARWLSQAFVELTFVLVAHFAGTFPFLPARGEAEARKLLGDVEDPGVREELTPSYRLGCKRPSFSNEYVRTFNRDNVHLATVAIEEITPEGVRTSDGVLHPIDVLVLATGYKVFEKGNMPPFPVRGAGGTELADFWDTNRQQAYEGVSVPGFPNWFTITGPYGFNGQSYFGLIETQMRHIVRCLKRARSERASRVEITPEANRRYFESVLARRNNQVFFRGSCAASNSYYFDKHGDVPFRPSLTLEAAWRSAHFDLDDYEFAASPAPAAG